MWHWSAEIKPKALGHEPITIGFPLRLKPDQKQALLEWFREDTEPAH